MVRLVRKTEGRLTSEHYHLHMMVMIIDMRVCLCELVLAYPYLNIMARKELFP